MYAKTSIGTLVYYSKYGVELYQMCPSKETRDQEYQPLRSWSNMGLRGIPYNNPRLGPGRLHSTVIVPETPHQPMNIHEPLSCVLGQSWSVRRQRVCTRPIFCIRPQIRSHHRAILRFLSPFVETLDDVRDGLFRLRSQPTLLIQALEYCNLQESPRDRA